MTPTHFLLRLKAHIDAQSWRWLMSALFQDQNIWRAVTETNLGEIALNTFAGNPESWTPAALSLITRGEEYSTSQLRDQGFSLAKSELFDQAQGAFQSWLDLDQPFTYDDPGVFIQQCGLVGLALREQRLQTDSWGFLTDLIAALPRERWSPFASLYGLIADPYELLLVLFLNQPDLAGHTLLSNPLPPEDQKLVLRTLLSELPHPQRAEAFAALQRQRVELACEIRAVLEQSQIDSDQLHTPQVSKYLERRSLSEIDQIVNSQYNAEISWLLGNTEGSSRSLRHALAATQRLEARLISRLADEINQPGLQGDETADEAIELLKKAVDLDNSTPGFQASLLAALINAGRFEEADGVTNHWDDDAATLFMTARLAKERGRADESAQLAKRAAEVIKTGRVYDENLRGLPGLLLDLGLDRQAIQTAQCCLDVQPFQPDILHVCGRAHLNLDETLKAVNCALIATTIEPQTIAYRSFLIETLKATHEWQSAYDEQEQVMQEMTAPGVHDYLTLASCAIGAQKLEEAQQACQSALEIEPDNPAIFNQLGQLALAKGDAAAAEMYYQQVLQLDPQDGETWISLSELYRSQGNTLLAMETLRTGMHAAPESAHIQYQLGLAMIAESAPTLALVPLRRALALAETPPNGQPALNLGAKRERRLLLEQVCLLLGNTLRGLGHLEESKSVFQIVCHLDVDRAPSNPEIAYNLAQTLLALCETPEALLNLEYVLQRQPENQVVAIHYARTMILLDPSTDKYLGAIRILDELLSDEIGDSQSGESPLNPAWLLTSEQYAEGYALLAEAKAATGELPDAMQAYRRALNSPLIQSPTWRYRLSLGLGKTASMLGLHETAITSLLDASEINVPEASIDPDLFRSLSESYEALELTSDAYQNACETLNLKEKDLDTLAWFASQCQALARQPAGKALPLQSQAIHALKQAVILAPTRLDLLVRLGQAQAQSGLRDEALSTFERLIEIDDDPDVHLNSSDLYHAAQTLEFLERPDKAALLLKRAIQMVNAEETGRATPMVQLMIELAHSQQQAGNLDQAMQACEQAIAAAESTAQAANHEVFLIKAELYLAQADLDGAQKSAEQALETEPTDAETSYRLAIIQAARQDALSALLSAERALLLASQDGDHNLELRARILAGQAASSLRLYEYGLSILNGIPEQSLPYEGICMVAEFACELGLQDLAAKKMVAAIELRPHDGRSLVIQGRLLAMQEGGSVTSSQLYQAALQEFEQGAFQDENSYTHLADKPTLPNEYLFILQQVNQEQEWRSLASALINDNRWQHGLALLERVSTLAGSQPACAIEMAQATLRRAEIQLMCQTLQVVKKAPGEEAVSRAAAASFNQSVNAALAKLQQSQDQLHAIKSKTPGDDDDGSVQSDISGALAQQINDELARISTDVQRLVLRGQVVFEQNHQAIQEYQADLAGRQPTPDEYAQLIGALARAGNQDEAIQAGLALGYLPPVALQLAWLQERNAALGTIQAARERITRPPAAGLDPSPLLLAQAGIISYTKFKDTADLKYAYQNMQAALAIWPDEPRWHALAAEIVLDIPEANGEPDSEAALAHLQQACSLEPDCAEHLYNLGKVNLLKENLAAAEIALEQATRISPDYGGAWLLLSRVQKDLGTLEKAAQSADYAIENLRDQNQAANSIDALLLRAEIALLGDNPRGALSRAQAILNIIPEHSGALYLVSRALSAMNQPAEALAAMEKIIVQSPPSLNMELERAALIDQAEGSQQAIETLQPLTELYPNNAQLYAVLSDLYFKAGIYDAGLQAARWALQYDHDDLTVETESRLHYQIGWQLRRLGQLDLAIHHLSEAIHRAPENLEYYLELGRTHQDRRQNGQAIEIYQLLTKLAPNDYRPFFQAGLALKDSKDYSEAETMFRRAAHLAPEETSIHRQLAAVVALNLVHNRRLSITE